MFFANQDSQISGSQPSLPSYSASQRTAASILELVHSIVNDGQVQSASSVNLGKFSSLIVNGDATAAVQAALDTGEDIEITEDYVVHETVFASAFKQKLFGKGSLTLASPTEIKPLLIVRQSAQGFRLGGLTFNHDSSQWANGAPFDPGIMGEPSGDARGISILVMADDALISNINVNNAWDVGLGIGRYDLTTGVQSSGPNATIVMNVRTYNCGSGKHNWGPAPDSYYFQGPGIDFLTARNFICIGCYDYGSYDGIWADVNGDARGLIAFCTCEDTRQGPIFSDAAAGGNKTWYQQGFGNNITFPGSGWMKTPGGTGFVSDSYGVHFYGCRSINPASVGFALGKWSSGNTIEACEVVGSGIAGIVDAGRKNKIISPTLIDCVKRYGTTAPSGSVCPIFAPIEIIGNAEEFVETEIHLPTIKKGYSYSAALEPNLNYPYAIYARAANINGSICKPKVFGGQITPGTLGKVKVDAGCSVSMVGQSGVHLVVDGYGGAPAVEIKQDGGGAGSFVFFLDSGGAAKLTNFTLNGKIVLDQQGSGAFEFWTNGQQKFVMTADYVQLPNLQTSPAGLPAGALWKNGTSLDIV
jgi:hypothetical protein